MNETRNTGELAQRKGQATVYDANGKEVKARKRKNTRYFMELLNAGKEATDWLCDAPIGTDQYEHGLRLRNAIKEFER